MSHVPEVEFHIKRGEDWTILVTFLDDDAPTEGEFANWDAFMEIRVKNSGTLLVRATTSESDGYITREMSADDEPTFRVQIPKLITRTFPVATHETDMLIVPDVDDSFYVFEGIARASGRVTLEEGE